MSGAWQMCSVHLVGGLVPWYTAPCQPISCHRNYLSCPRSLSLTAIFPPVSTSLFLLSVSLSPHLYPVPLVLMDEFIWFLVHLLGYHLAEWFLWWLKTPAPNRGRLRSIVLYILYIYICIYTRKYTYVYSTQGRSRIKVLLSVMVLKKSRNSKFVVKRPNFV